jgi:pimeloyl-ACP methyl ester carboxylesterase
MQTNCAYLPIRKSRIFFETMGEGEPLLLLHGGLGTIGDFAHQRPQLAKSFMVVAFERPGHGHTADTDEPFTFATMLGYTIDFIEALGLGAMNLVGWSDGAIISLLLAIARPDLVKRIVCVSGNFDTSFYTPSTLESFRATTLESFKGERGNLVGMYGDVGPDSVPHFSPIVLEKTMAMWSKEPDIKPGELAKIRAPTLVMSGDRDVIPLEHTIALFRHLGSGGGGGGGAEMCIVPGATHFLLAEKPRATTMAILDFLLTGEKEGRDE